MSKLYEAYWRVLGAVEETKKILLDNKDRGYRIDCRINTNTSHPNIRVSITKSVCGRKAASDVHFPLFAATDFAHCYLVYRIMETKMELDEFIESQKPKPDIANYAYRPKVFFSTPTTKPNPFYEFMFRSPMFTNPPPILKYRS